MGGRCGELDMEVGAVGAGREQVGAGRGRAIWQEGELMGAEAGGLGDGGGEAEVGKFWGRPVGRAEEVGMAGVGRLVVELVGSAGEGQLAVVEAEREVGGQGEGRLVCGEDQLAGSAGGELEYQVPEGGAGGGVDVGERLIEQQQARLAGEGAGEREACGLALGKIARARAGLWREAEAVEPGEGGGVAVGGWQDIGDVGERGAARPEAEGGWDPAGRDRRCGDLAVAGSLVSCEDIEERSLAGAGGAEQGDARGLERDGRQIEPRLRPAVEGEGWEGDGWHGGFVLCPLSLVFGLSWKGCGGVGVWQGEGCGELGVLSVAGVG
jgi:hypothetical protein